MLAFCKWPPCISMGTSLLEQFLQNLEICQNSVTHGLKERISDDLSICKAGDKFHQDVGLSAGGSISIGSGPAHQIVIR
ncbi:hypothetical protein NL676_030233 [Syzygium grande]|nr:hypothetical protein NL676_030233 [Syzygium grande]